MNALLVIAQGGMGAWSIGQWAIFIVVIAAVCAVVYVALRQFNISIPAWVIQILWILAVAVVCVLAIKFLLTLF